MISTRVLLPIAILGVGILGFSALLATRPEVDRSEPEMVAPLVRVVTVAPATLRLSVEAHGTVEPPIESELRAQVDGEILWVSPQLAPGGFFEADAPLIRVDAMDYEQEREAARAARDRALSAFSRTRRELERLERLASESAASVSRVDEARDEHRAADAALREARVRLKRAERDLERTELVAPYAGRTREKSVDVGQFIRRGDDLARLYAIDYAEVPLPVPDRELAFLDLMNPFEESDRDETTEGPIVHLRAEFAGVQNEWTGRLVRTTAEIDPRSRTVTVVARVEDPYGRSPNGPPVPLPVGLFVEAEISGREIQDAIVLPTTALRQGSQVYVVDDEGRIRFRNVEVLRNRRNEVVVRNGLQAGERIVITPLRGAVEGMRVRVAEDDDSLEEATR
jgi:RND family efflux transporter MFP subunit